MASDGAVGTAKVNDCYWSTLVEIDLKGRLKKRKKKKKKEKREVNMCNRVLVQLVN